MKCVSGGTAATQKMSSLYLGSELPTLTSPPATTRPERAVAEVAQAEGLRVSFTYKVS